MHGVHKAKSPVWQGSSLAVQPVSLSCPKLANVQMFKRPKAEMIGKHALDGAGKECVGST